MKNKPKRIYLNTGVESESEAEFNSIDFNDLEGVRWSIEPADGITIEYILATPALKAAYDERQRQIEKEGYDEKHDDEHFKGEIARAAATYAQPRLYRTDDFRGAPSLWPWHKKYWKPTPDDRKREITKAMALLIAEYERLERKEEKYCFDTNIEQKEFDRITKGWDSDSIERYGNEAREGAKTYARGYRDAQAKYKGLYRKPEPPKED